MNAVPPALLQEPTRTGTCSYCQSPAKSISHVEQVEAKYPALLFKQQLDAFVQKIFPMLRDNVKKEITPQLAACIHAPRTASTRSRRSHSTLSNSSDAPLAVAGQLLRPPFAILHSFR